MWTINNGEIFILKSWCSSSANTSKLLVLKSFWIFQQTCSRWDQMCTVLIQRLYNWLDIWTWGLWAAEHGKSWLIKVILLSQYLYYVFLPEYIFECSLENWNLEFSSLVLFVMHFPLCVGSTEEELKSREVACLPGLSGSLLLRYYLWRGAEGCAAALHSSSHICGKTPTFKVTLPHPVTSSNV